MLILSDFYFLYSQEEGKITSALTEAGFENVRVARSEDDLYVTIENNVFRWDVAAIARALDLVSESIVTPYKINLVLLEKGIPRILVSTGSAHWQDFREGILTAGEYSGKLNVTYDTGGCWEILRETEPSGPDTWKFDLVAYPQFYFENTLTTKLYTSQLNIAPALEVIIRKGMKLTGQVIFPVYNQMGYEGDFIRPGFVTLIQEFRLPHKWFGALAGGNFSASRYGFDLSLKHPFKNENWNMELNAGFTGSSHFFGRKWTHSSLNMLTASASMTYFYPKFALEIRTGAARYIYGDYGLFGTMTRRFRETIVGFYAQLGEHSVNGGFKVTVPLPGKKRPKHDRFRITLPENYLLSYNAGTEFYYGQNYLTNLDYNQKNIYIFTSSTKLEILNLKNNPRR